MERQQYVCPKCGNMHYESKPYQIQQEGPCPAAVSDFLSKGKETQAGKFKALYSYGDTNNGDTFSFRASR